jgi:hypothetical protein
MELWRGDVSRARAFREAVQQLLTPFDSSAPQEPQNYQRRRERQKMYIYTMTPTCNMQCPGWELWTVEMRAMTKWVADDGGKGGRS